MARIESATPSPDQLLYEAVDTQTNGPALTTGAIRRGGWAVSWGPTTQNLLGAVLGTVTYSAYGGRVWRTAVSGVPAGGKGEQSTTTPVGQWPINVNLAGISPQSQNPARYDFDVLLHRDAPLAAVDVPFGVTFMYHNGTQTLLSLAVNTWVGISVESRSTVNGGNWTRYNRNTSGGVLTSLDLGIHPDAGPLHVLFRYEATATNPTFYVILNGTIAETFVGLGAAAMCQPRTFAAGLQRLGVCQIVGAVVGQTDRWVQSHVKIERLPGFKIF
jgi:hypothetical protein